MNSITGWLIVIGIVALLLFGIWWLKLYIKKKEGKFVTVPEDIIKQFNECERLLAESDGHRDPYEIMYTLSRQHNLKGGLNGKSKTTRTEETNTGGNNSSTLSTEPATQSADSNREPERRINIQNAIASSNHLNNNTTTGTQQTSKRAFNIREFFAKRSLFRNK